MNSMSIRNQIRNNDCISMETVRAIVTGGQYVGGETSEAGDSVQFEMDGETFTVFLSETFGDEGPSDVQIVETAEAVGVGMAGRRNATPVQ